MPNNNMPELKSVAHSNSTYWILPNGQTDQNYRESSGEAPNGVDFFEVCRYCGHHFCWSTMPPLHCSNCDAIFKSPYFI